MLISVTISTWQKEWTEMLPEAYVELRKHVPSLPEDKTKISYGGHIIIDDIGLKAMHRLGIRMEISDDPNIDTMLVKIQQRMDELENKTRDIHAFNDRVQIAIPDQRLMLITEVDWMEDACTQDLQSRLNDGWRILAVCPPNAQRRPDYILGRTKTDGK